jgi:hypothetical protein
MTYFLHFAETKNVQQEESEVEQQPCVQGSSEPKLKRRKASTHLAVGVQNARALPPIHMGSSAYSGVWDSQPPNWVPPGGSWMAPQRGPWMPQQGGGWMLPGPQYMQPIPMVESPIQSQVTPDSATRGSHRRKRKFYGSSNAGEDWCRSKTSHSTSEGRWGNSRKVCKLKGLGCRCEDQYTGHECLVMEGTISQCHCGTEGAARL